LCRARSVWSGVVMPATPTHVLGRDDVQRVASTLLEAFETGRPISPLSESHPGLTVDDAYAIQRALAAGHARARRVVTGRKIGLTSTAIQQQLGVDSPDFGLLFDSHTFPSGARVSMRSLHAILPRVEGEIGFVLAQPLAGPGVTADDVRAAIAHVQPVFELIDSRIREWKISLADTVADNASSLGAVLGEPVPLAAAEPLAELRMTLQRDGETLHEGAGAAVLGDPALAVAWLANELGARGDELPAGQPILSGSLTAAVDATPGRYVADFGPAVGAVRIEIEE
jgi:2-keto-4-pentenoate hydratase